MTALLIALNVIAGLFLVAVVLLQAGKGADMGAAFGSGSAGSLFGSAGASNFLSKTTAVLAATFFVTSLGLTYLSAPSKTGGVTEGLAVPAGKSDVKPAVPAPSGSAPAGSPEKSTEIPK